MNPTPKYSVLRCRDDGSIYGPIHLSTEATKTLCGLWMLSERWWILTNDGTGKPTCKKCIAVSAQPKKP